MNALVTIEGIVEDIIYTNEANGYTVCDVKDDKEIITAVGFMPFISIGESIKIIGKWVEHPDYGEQLKVECYEKLLPKTADAIEKYLASGVLKGIGPATAAKIVKKFGDDTLNIIGFKPQQLSLIRGISLEKAIKIGQDFNEQQGLRNVMLFFQEYGISPVHSMKIYKIFGDRAIDEIKENPYKLSEQIFGITFKIADRLAMSLGIDPMSIYRVCSGIKHVLTQSAVNGHTYLPEEKLLELTSQLLEVEIDQIRDACIKLLLDKAIYMDKSAEGNRVYLSTFYNAELSVCKRLIGLSTVEFKNDAIELEKRINDIQEEEGIVFAENQLVAVKEALAHGVIVITGGPGTGKTTIIKSIIKLMQRDGFNVALTAPTGRAAKRMTETTGFEAKTIHRLLEIGYSSDNDEMVFTKSDSNPIEADAIIVDEMSMVDIILMNSLLKAIEPGTRLILVGDVDQLPSVGPGCVLKDIISSNMIGIVRLTEIFRQAEESMIVVNAHRINKGDLPHLNVKGKDFFFMPRNSGDQIVSTIAELCYKRLPAKYDYDPMKQIQVLTPTKKGPTGVLNMNKVLQKYLNPEERTKREKAYRDFVFREGDRVMQIRNNYTIRWEKSGLFTSEGQGVFNGDTGIIIEIDNDEHFVKVLFDDDKIVEYDFSILDELELAYAITIHKSQGSEFPAVIIPLYSGPEILLTRNLLYTAITRAKDMVILVGYENVLRLMINNLKEMQRYSSLSERLISGFAGICF
ncbi:ATP-dependent RecD-like DNA helicase [Pseudobacteroides sp.]|uniref:SF1B family DNA helicase RecD2 n=1 Tax=Pseudobacteroides sp. TaxID=1968840 RepID=UPI002FDD79BA